MIGDSVPLLFQKPWLYLGLPSLCFIMSASWLKKQRDGALVTFFEYVALTFFVSLVYFATRHLYHDSQRVLDGVATFFERGVITNLFFLMSAIFALVSSLIERPAFKQASVVLMVMALARLTIYDLIWHNPLFDNSQHVGSYTLINYMLLNYAAPVAWCLFFNKIYGNNPSRRILFRGLALAFSFFWISLNVRLLYNPSSLGLTGHFSNAEFYTYSVVWLLFGITLVTWGIRKKNQLLRMSSLIIILLTVCKVFLLDFSMLEGLLRVLSFFGLGLSLLGLSHFYAKFVFKRDVSAHENSS